jgi:hypothetical protein
MFSGEFLISGSNNGFLIVISIVLRKWLFSYDFEIVKPSNCSVKLSVISSENSWWSLSNRPCKFSLCLIVNELLGPLFSSDYL